MKIATIPTYILLLSMAPWRCGSTSNLYPPGGAGGRDTPWEETAEDPEIEDGVRGVLIRERNSIQDVAVQDVIYNQLLPTDDDDDDAIRQIINTCNFEGGKNLLHKIVEENSDVVLQGIVQLYGDCIDIDLQDHNGDTVVHLASSTDATTEQFFLLFRLCSADVTIVN